MIDEPDEDFEDEDDGLKEFVDFGGMMLSKMHKF